MKYTLSEFGKIKLPKNVLSIDDKNRLFALTKKIHVTSYNKKPPHKNKRYSNRRGNRATKPQVTEMNWKLIRSFKKTKLNKNEKDCDEGIFDNIRGLINKLTKENYPEKKKAIFHELAMLIKEKKDTNNRFALVDDSSDDESIEVYTHEENEKLLKIGKIIFDIASKFIFWVELFVELYDDINKKYTIMKGIAVKNFNKYSGIMYDIKNVDPEEDYDEFCRINKVNEKRRCLSKFFTLLVNKNILFVDNIVTILEKFVTLIELKICEEGCLNDVEELSENIEIILQTGCEKFKNHEKYESIICNINKISKYNVKNYPSLNRRILFKLMDCIDFVKKV